MIIAIIVNQVKNRIIKLAFKDEERLICLKNLLMPAFS